MLVRSPLEPAPSDLNQIVGDVIELMRGRAVSLDVTLRWTPATDLPTLMFDPDGLHRAILNVVTNAIDACDTAEAGTVEVTTHYVAAERIARVIVSDNGSGIAPGDIEKIFAIFVSRKGGRGTGLGLPVSQKIFKEHGGRILVTSQPGQGSRFTLELPAVFPTQPEPSGATLAANESDPPRDVSEPTQQGNRV